MLTFRVEAVFLLSPPAVRDPARLQAAHLQAAHLQPEHCFEQHSASVSWLCYKLAYLCPFLVPALHLDCGDSCKHFICWQVLRQPGQKLSTVDEVHPGQDVLKKLQDTQSCAEEKFLSISTEYIPDAAGQVQGQGLTV